MTMAHDIRRNSAGTLRARKVVPLIALALVMGLSGCKIFGGKGGPKTPTVGDRTPILSRIESGARIDSALGGVSVILPPAETNASWAQGGGNANKSYGHLALSDAPRKVWSAQIASANTRQRYAASPVVAGDKLFVMDTAGVVHALNAQTGRQLWTKSFSVAGTSAAQTVFGGGVSADADRVYVTTGLGEVAAISAEDGKTIWSKKPAGPLRGAPTIAFNSVYVMTQDNQLFALNAEDGTSVWNESGSLTQSGVFGVAAPSAGQGTLIAGYSSGELVAYRYENGRQLWSDALSRTSISTEVGSLTDVDADPIVDQGKVYALGQGGRMAAYELVTGQRIWELNLAGISTPALAGDWIFTLDNDAELLAINRNSGKVRWLTQLARYENAKKKKGPIFWVGPVLAGNKLWIASTRGDFSTVDPMTGAVSTFQQINDPISLPPVIANQTLYLLDDSGRLTAYR